MLQRNIHGKTTPAIVATQPCQMGGQHTGAECPISIYGARTPIALKHESADRETLLNPGISIPLASRFPLACSRLHWRNHG
jgi:hypothetical protein